MPTPLVPRPVEHGTDSVISLAAETATAGPPRRGPTPPPVDDPSPGPADPGPLDDPPPTRPNDPVEEPPPDEDAPGPIDEPPAGRDEPADIDDPLGRRDEPPLQVSRRGIEVSRSGVLRPHDGVRISPTGVAPLGSVVETDLPARLDRLPWGRFHTLVVAALGITWILDGLEVTLAGTLAGALKESPVLRFSNADVGFATSAYLAGAVLGAVFFGWLTDRLGRKKLFFVTLAVYLTATAGTALTWDVWSFAAMRFVTGAGIGGEYAAINSTIQELVPARVRGWTDLVINGSFWLGAAAGAAGSILVLDPAVIHPEYGWRLAFLIGAALGLVVLLMRMWIPESPRWLMTHGRVGQAEAVVAGIERSVLGTRSRSRDDLPTVRLRVRHHTPFSAVADALLVRHRDRAAIGLVLMAAQAFFFNAVFFTYALVLTDFYGVAAASVGWYILPFAAGNFLGPLLLGRLFDTLGRRPMIVFTYATSGVLLAMSGLVFQKELITVGQQTVAWSVVFFFASAAASAAYLTVSETFPLEIRALTIAVFYALGTGIGGVAGPWLFGALIDSGSRSTVFAGYLFGAALMVAAAVVHWRYGIAAERKSLEDVARPLAAVD